MVMESFSSLSTRCAPWQTEHGGGDDLAAAVTARARGDVDEGAKDRLLGSAICPDPPHSGHRVGCVPGSAPLPLQFGQVTIRDMLISRSVPKTASSNEISRS
jgi:hypothetical protein